MGALLMVTLVVGCVAYVPAPAPSPYAAYAPGPPPEAIVEVAPAIPYPEAVWIGGFWAFHGGKDPVVPLASSEKMVEALKKNGSEVKFTIYPDAGHAFCNDERPANHHPAAAQDAWARTLAFLRAHVSP